MAEHTSDWHSSEYLTRSSRSFWWNDDFLHLLARRWGGLETVQTALDVGCGIGHWTFAMASHLAAGSTIIGLDREPQWIERANAASARHEGPAAAAFRLGSAENLPFGNDSLDLVTCQTLLIHVRDPLVVLREMRRVLKPGGLLVLIEPANVASAVLFGSAALSANDVARYLDFYLTCERGKAVCGEGDNSIGDQVPGMVASLEFERMQVYLSDRAAPLFPPYASPAQSAQIGELESALSRSMWVWDRDTTGRYFIAGGGAVNAFEAHWSHALHCLQVVRMGIRVNTYHCGGGSVVYVVSARKR